MQLTASTITDPAVIARLARIKLLLLDVDGVLTDGRIIYDSSGAEIKAFHVRDGIGLRLLMAAGKQVGIITGRSSQALSHRCRDLGIDMLFDGVQEKGKVFQQVLDTHALSPEEVAFVGDDLPDLPPMRRAGLAVAVADAHPLVLNLAHMVTESCGGKGAVREVCEAILSAQGLWEKVLERF